MFFLLGLWLALAQQVQVRPYQQPARPNPNAPQQADLKPATVRGRVVAADTGEPVRFARVTLRLNAAASTTFSASADANGTYEIRNVDPGNYSGTASKAGFVTRNFSRGNNFAPLQLAEAEEAKDINFSLARAAVISGTVLDDREEPVPHAHVFAMARAYNGAQMTWQQRAQAQTDDRGQFRLHDIPAGRYYLQASYMGGAIAPHYAPTLFPNAKRLADAQSIKITGGEESAGIKITLHETTVYSVAGTVVDDTTGTAVAANINLQPEDYSAGGSSAFANTKNDGTFRLSEVAPGRYRVFINVRDMEPGSPTNRNVIRSLDVSDHDIDNAVFHVGPGSTMTGRVIADGGDLPPSLQVQMTSRDGNGNPNYSRGFTTQADGTFEVKDLNAGHVELNVNSRGLIMMQPNNPPTVAPATMPKPFYVRTITVNNQDVTDTGVIVPEQAATLEVTVTLDFHTGLVTGHTTDPSGNPLANATVAMIARDPKKRSIARYTNRSRSDAQGLFTIAGVIPGDYLILVWPTDDRGALFDPDVAAIAEKYATSISVSPDATASVDLRLSSELPDLIRTLVPEP